MSQRGLLGLDAKITQAALRVAQRPVEQLEQIGLFERPEFENLGAGNQGGVDKEEGVVSGRPDQADHTGFHIGQQHVLLGFVKPVDFVNKENGELAGVFETVGCGR